jgi:hypothetical protein
MGLDWGIINIEDNSFTGNRDFAPFANMIFLRNLFMKQSAHYLYNSCCSDISNLQYWHRKVIHELSLERIL